MEPSRPQLIILAESPEALVVLFGISFVERLLRMVQRLGFRDAVILSSSPDDIAAHLSRPSWARAEVGLTFRKRTAGAVRISDVALGAGRLLIISAGFYYDSRLLKTLAEHEATTLLVDSAPPPDSTALWNGEPLTFRAAALVESSWLSQQDYDAALMDLLSSEAATGGITACDAADQPTYLMGLRKHVRPVFFPAPPPGLIAAAEQFPRNAAQNGVLDFPALVHAPIENWLVARLCRSSITPNQITLFTIIVGISVTVFFITGHLWSGLALALIVGVLDGVDGKLARTKVETTEVGDWEHVTDYFIELSWWSALAWHFHASGLPGAFWLLLLLVGADWVDRAAKRVVKNKVGRNLDDVSNFDRFVRCIGARRNINIWMLTAALALGDAANGFGLICWWGAATAASHVVRAFQIRKSTPTQSA